MEGNNTSEYNMTADNDTIVEKQPRFYEIVGDRWMAIIAWFLFVVTLTAVVYGVTSWCLIKKFRHFRNYVILSAIIARMLMLSVFLTEELVQNLVVHILTVALIMYCTHTYYCWLLVLCLIFYVDFVKVFHLNIRRRFLKSSLFAWGIPGVANVLLILPALFLHVYGWGKIEITRETMTIIFISAIFIPVAISLVLYVAVVYALFRGSGAGASTSFNKWCRFYLATLIFVFSNGIVLTGILDFFGIRILIIDAIGDVVGEFLNTIALAVYFIILKSNRELWREFFVKRSNLKSLEIK